MIEDCFALLAMTNKEIEAPTACLRQLRIDN